MFFFFPRKRDNSLAPFTSPRDSICSDNRKEQLRDCSSFSPSSSYFSRGTHLPLIAVSDRKNSLVTVKIFPDKFAYLHKHIGMYKKNKPIMRLIMQEYGILCIKQESTQIDRFLLCINMQAMRVCKFVWIDLYMLFHNLLNACQPHDMFIKVYV